MTYSSHVQTHMGMYKYVCKDENSRYTSVLSKCSYSVKKKKDRDIVTVNFL